jgi:molybdate-binding protein
MVLHGNPQGLTGYANLARTDVRIVNRPPGTGTRVLLDHRLEQLGISPAAVTGYQREEPHSAAIAAVIRAGQAPRHDSVVATAKRTDHPLLQRVGSGEQARPLSVQICDIPRRGYAQICDIPCGGNAQVARVS